MVKAPSLSALSPSKQLFLIATCLYSFSAFADDSFNEMENLQLEQVEDHNQEIAAINIFQWNPLQYFFGDRRTSYSTTEECLTPTAMALLQLRHLEGNGIGFPRGYTTADLMITMNPVWEGKVVPFIDMRGHYFNDKHAAANFGIGERYVSSFNNYVLGFNFYYDYRDFHKGFHQIGLGMEVFSRYVDFRANGYLPFANKKEVNGAHNFRFPGGFKAQCRTFKRALPGIDLEFATSLTKALICNDWDFFIAAGPYYYRNHGCGGKENIWGGRGRFGFQFLQHFSLELRATYDNMFHGIVQGIVALTLPLGKRYRYLRSKDKDRDDSLWVMARQLVFRNEIIVLNRKNCQWKTNFCEDCD